MNPLTDDEVVTRLRARADDVLPTMTLDSSSVRAAGRRRVRTRAWSAVSLGLAATFAVGVVLSNVVAPAPNGAAPASTGGATAAAPDAGAVTLAQGVTAATGVVGTGSPWQTGLTQASDGGRVDIQLAAGTAKDRTDAFDGSGVRVEHALRVVLSGAGAPTTGAGSVAQPATIAWPEPFLSTTETRSRTLPWLTTMYRGASDGAGGEEIRVARVMAGVVPTDLVGAHVVLYSTEGLTSAAGKAVHAVEVPTFTDPAGSGATIYLVSADERAAAGPSPLDGMFYVQDDGTVLDPDDRCPATAECVSGDDPALHAALMNALDR